MAWTDFDGDGQRDVFVVQPSGAGVLYRGAAAGQLLDATAEMGLFELPALSSASWQDANGDGRDDLLVVLRSGEVRLFANEGGQHLVDVTRTTGLALEGVVSASWSDFDQDGHTDLIARTLSGHVIGRNLGEFAFERLMLEDPQPARAPMVGPGMARSGAQAVPGGSDVTDQADGTAPSSGGRQALVGGGPATGGSLPITPVDPQIVDVQLIPGGGGCADSIMDQATGGCVTASSVPAVGSLYPLSSDFFINDVTGFVGLGTMFPSARLNARSTNIVAPAVWAEHTGDTSALIVQKFGQVNPAVLIRADGGPALETDGIVEIGYGSPFGVGVSTKIELDGTSQNGRIRMFDTAGTQTVVLNGGQASGGSSLFMTDSDGIGTVSLDAEFGSSGARFSLRRTNGLNGLVMQSIDSGSPGSLFAMNSGGNIQTVEILSEEFPGNGAQIALATAAGLNTIILDAQGSTASEIAMRTLNNVETVELRSQGTGSNGGRIVLRKADGTSSIILNAEQSGLGRITAEVVEITGGADLVESFRTDGVVCVPGSVLVIDPQNPGQLMLSTNAYDARVAGVVSGAGGVRAGLHLGQRGVADGDTPVALTGRVYVRCSAENGAIEPGDLLTSSDTPGVAMRASDSQRAFGAVIGKAMGALAAGEEGLVLVLVGLQ